LLNGALDGLPPIGISVVRDTCFTRPGAQHVYPSYACPKDKSRA
jgi:hypothetical protein